MKYPLCSSLSNRYSNNVNNHNFNIYNIKRTCFRINNGITPDSRRRIIAQHRQTAILIKDFCAATLQVLNNSVRLIVPEQKRLLFNAAGQRAIAWDRWTGPQWTSPSPASIHCIDRQRDRKLKLYSNLITLDFQQGIPFLKIILSIISTSSADRLLLHCSRWCLGCLRCGLCLCCGGGIR